MSNNIYDILKKFNNLDSVKNMLSEGKKVCKDCGEVKCKCIDESKGSKPDFLDMDKDGDKKEPMKKAAKEKSKGAIAEAVARVEQQLAEKYQGFKMDEGLDDNYKTPNWDRQKELMKDPSIKAFDAQQNANSRSSASMGAMNADERGQQRYKDRTSPGVINKVKDFIGIDKPDAAYGPRDMKEGEYNEDMLSPGQKKIAKMSPPSNKIDAGDLAALRKGKKNEGNAFSGAVAKAKATGQGEFKVGGKEYKVQEGFPTVADAQKRHKEQTGKTTHGTKTKTATGTRHERNYDHDDAGVDRATGEKRGRGRPKADRFA